MGENKPQDDAKAMYAEYVKGATVSFLADKYGWSEQEVYDVVVREEKLAPVVAQAQADVKVEDKKVK